MNNSFYIITIIQVQVYEYIYFIRKINNNRFSVAAQITIDKII